MSMGDNPYEAPGTNPRRAGGAKRGRRKNLRDVALAQKGILVCILIQILLIVGQYLAQPNVQPILRVGYLIVSLVGTICVFLLAMRVYNVGLGILFGIGALIPCVGLIILLVVNGKATTILQQNGYTVGLLGADMSEFRKG